MSDFREAVQRQQGHDFLVCPKCGSVDLAPSSTGQIPSPTLEPEQDGSYTCTICAAHWTPPRKD